ncbi:MAG TPA: peptidylprolyl isomerase, partial [Candidatus Babeliaceae bacterium]|nr:peptidylprolyl isomerase [Candidatus Babeliaceae bacterium]
MIALIRKRLQGPLYQSVLWITIFSLLGGIAFTGLFRRFSGLPSTDVATVNGYEVTALELRRKAQEEERYFQYLKQILGESAQAFLEAQGIQGTPIERALDSLIKQKLVLGLANSLGIQLDPEYITEQFGDPMFRYQILGEMVPAQLLVGDNFDQRQLTQLLQRQGVSLNDLEDIIETSIKNQIALGLVQGALYIPKAMLKERFMRDYRGKKYTIATLPLDFFEQEIRATKQITHEEALKFFNQQNEEQHRYLVPQKRDAVIWTFEPSSYDLTATDSEIEQYYNQHKQQFIAQENQANSEPTYKELKEVTPAIREIVINEKFRRIFAGEAQRALHDPSSLKAFIEKKHGKRTILENQEKNPSALSTKIFELKNKGQLGVLVQGNQGMIVELTNKKEAYTPEFESVKQKVT